MNSLKDIKWYGTVKVKMISLLILTMIVVMTIASFFSYSYLKDFETERLTQFADISADRLSKSLETPMWNIDRAQVDELLNTEMAEKTIVGITVLDEGNRGVFLSKGRDQLTGQVINYSGSFSKDHIFVTRNIVRESKNIGTIEMYITQKYLDEILFTAAVTGVVVVVVLALAIFLLMNILLSRIVIAPLLELADSADAISRGELNQSFDIGSKDEIGYLGESFKKMQISLRIAMNRLSEPEPAPEPTPEPVKKTTFSKKILQELLREIRMTGRMPSLTSIFKFAASRGTIPDDLVEVAWKEWNKNQQKR